MADKSDKIILPESTISYIKFVPYTNDDILRDAEFVVRNVELYRNSEPVQAGLYDLHMGPTLIKCFCGTCNDSIKNCTGHFARFEVPYPLLSMLTLKNQRHWLGFVCLNPDCRQIMFENLAAARLKKRKDRLAFIAAQITNNKKKICPHCGAIHPIIVTEREIGSKANIYIKYVFGDGPTVTLKLPPHIISEIDNSIPLDVIKDLDLDPSHHPSNYVHKTGFLVSPNNLRPNNILSANVNENTGNPEFTRMLMTIGKKLIDTIPKNSEGLRRLKAISYNNLFMATNQSQVMEAAERIKEELDIKEVKSCMDEIETLQQIIYDYQFGSKTASTNITQIKLRTNLGTATSVGSKMLGKKGAIRLNLQGVRCENVFRDVIIGSATTRLDYILIPLYIARICKEQMTVQEYNFNIAQTYVMNERAGKYPGCTYIKKKKNGTMYNLRERHSTIEIEYGDIIFRDIVYGDMPYWNRQPSLTDSAITAVRTEINTNVLNQAVAFNAITCKFYGADFDGDNMQGGFVSTYQAKAELKYLMSAPAHLISPQYSMTAIGEIEEAIVGAAKLTQYGVMLHKYHAMPLFRNTSMMCTFEEPREYTGREIMSKVIPSGVNYKITPACVKGDYKNYIHYDQSDLVTRIEKGIISSGILDKSALGTRQFNGLFQTINREHGPSVTLDAMFNIQQLSVAYADIYGLTYSPYDYGISNIARQLIERASAADVTKAWEKLDKLIEGKIATPINMTMSQYIEELMIQNWRQDYTNEILAGLPSNSSIVTMIITGSKGKIPNLQEMVSLKGQVIINKERPPKQFGYKRTLPYTTRYSLDPLDNGLIINSLGDGMTTKEYYFSCQADRYNLIIKALMTAVSGTSSRTSMRSLESNRVSYIFRTVLKNQSIYQLTYGINNYDCRYIELVELDHIELSNENFDKKFKSFAADSTKNQENDKFNNIFVEEYLQILKDRNTYRNIWIKQESLAIQPVFNNRIQVPIHIRHLVLKMSELRTKAPDREELAKMVLMVKKYCEQDILYTMFNKRFREKNIHVPDFVERSFLTTCMHIREVLNSNTHLRDLNLELLGRVLDLYSVHIKNAFIAPGSATGIIASQSISEPITQYNLSATQGAQIGGTSKMGMKRINDIMKNKEDVNAQMLINISPQYTTDTMKIEEIISHIEMLSFHALTTLRQIFYEPPGRPVYPTYLDESKMIEKFIELNPLIRAPSGLSGWCFRFEIDQDRIVLKKISMTEIVTKLTDQFPELFCVYTPENAKKIVLRIYTTKLGDRNSYAEIEEYFNQILNVPIRGIKGIKSANVTSKKMMMLDEKTGEFKMTDRKCIYTAGSNIARIVGVKGIDLLSLQSDSIPEMYRVYGIEAARMKLINEYRALVSDVNYQHIAVYVDEMCHSTGLSEIARSGLEKREKNNTLLRMSNVNPVQSLQDAVMNSHESKIYGVSAPLFLGRQPDYGTKFCSIVMPMLRESDPKPFESQTPMASILDEF